MELGEGQGGMDYVFTQIIDLAPIALVSIPIIVATLVLALLAGTGVAGRVARRACYRRNVRYRA